ncbi:hypothetical protein [Methanobrevibacter sp. DSM 116169]|uniref:hypothetical protein n=1 Tax=Methanobrevibacter sp. DSM 116169 TaxID=3242727 RepID=UPI0038FCCC40
MKLKNKKDNYIRNSVYNVLGYLKDFDEVPFAKNIIGVILLGKEGKLNKKTF